MMGESLAEQNARLDRERSFPLTQHELSILDGLLLGDGCLYRPSRKSVRYVHSSKYKETLDSIVSALNRFEFGPIYQRQIPENVTKHGVRIGQSVGWVLASRGYRNLVPLYLKWYPEGHKRVPADILLSPDTCYHWYIGDGSLHTIKLKDGSSRANQIALHTNGFSDECRHILSIALRRDVGVSRVGVVRRGELMLNGQDVETFLSFIGPCRNTEYEYKWEFKPYIYGAHKNSQRPPDAQAQFVVGSTLERMVAALRNGPRIKTELSQSTGLSRATINTWIRDRPSLFEISTRPEDVGTKFHRKQYVKLRS